MNDDIDLDIIGYGTIIANNWRVDKKIGQGGFGIVYQCFNQKSKEFNILKIENSRNCGTSSFCKEISFLNKLKNEVNFPQIISNGKHKQYCYIVMSQLGQSIEELHKQFCSKFSLLTVLNISIQMIDRLETLHRNNIIHRDIKPENLLIGEGQNYNVIYLIDFGLSKTYKNEKDVHLVQKKKKGLIGTARFASVNAHLHLEQSRKDDLESLGYLIVYLVKGRLPWQSIAGFQKSEQYEKIKEMKINYSVEKICSGCPSQLVQYLKIIKNLSFQEKPNYLELKQIFGSLILTEQSYHKYKLFEWENLFQYKQYTFLQNDKVKRVKSSNICQKTTEQASQEFPLENKKQLNYKSKTSTVESQDIQNGLNSQILNQLFVQAPLTNSKLVNYNSSDIEESGEIQIENILVMKDIEVIENQLEIDEETSIKICLQINKDYVRQNTLTIKQSISQSVNLLRISSSFESNQLNIQEEIVNNSENVEDIYEQNERIIQSILIKKPYKII